MNLLTTKTNQYVAEHTHGLHSKLWCSTLQNEIGGLKKITIV